MGRVRVCVRGETQGTALPTTTDNVWQETSRFVETVYIRTQSLVGRRSTTDREKRVDYDLV